MSTSISTHQYSSVQRAALAVSAALAAWAEASVRRERASAAVEEGAYERSLRLHQAEQRRQAAIIELSLLPRQF